MEISPRFDEHWGMIHCASDVSDVRIIVLFQPGEKTTEKRKKRRRRKKEKGGENRTKIEIKTYNSEI